MVSRLRRLRLTLAHGGAEALAWFLFLTLTVPGTLLVALTGIRPKYRRPSRFSWAAH